MADKPTILIVDDDPTIRDMYEQRFQKAGFEVIVASNGDEGMKQALTHRPKAILLDIMMPTKGGLGTLEVLKTMPETKDIPVVVFTAYPADQYKETSQRTGAAHFLSKSEVMPGEVVEKVQALLAEKQ